MPTSHPVLPHRSLAPDLAVLVPGWLVVLGLEPFVATVFGLPLAALAIGWRRLVWPTFTVRGRIVIALLHPVLTLALAASVALGSGGASLGLLLAAAALSVVEGLNRRRGQSLVRDYPLFGSGAFLVLAAVATRLVISAGVTAPPTEELLKAYAAPADPPRWGDKGRVQAVAAIREAVAQDLRNDARARHWRDRLAARYPALVRLRAPHGVAVTLYEGSGFRARGLAQGGRDALEDLLAATARAVSQKPRQPNGRGTRPRAWNLPQNAVRVSVDVLGPTRRAHLPLWVELLGPLFAQQDKKLAKVRAVGLPLGLTAIAELGVDGMLLRDPETDEQSLLLPSDPLTEGWLAPRVDSSPLAFARLVDRAWKRDHGQKHADPGRLEVALLRSAAFAETRAGGEIVQLYRGNRLFAGELDRARLVEGIKQASDWLARQVKEDGSFHYEIFVPYKRETDDYNLPRHAGSIFGLFEVAHAARGEPALTAAGQRALTAGLGALAYVNKNLGSPDPGRPELKCFLAKDGDAESGSTALAALALAALPPAEEIADAALRQRVAAVPVEAWLKGMGECLLSFVDSRGKVFRGYREARQKKLVEKEPLYFPGEVMLALGRINARVPDPRWVEAARRIGERQIGIFYWPLKLGVSRSPDHWIMQALPELARATKDDRFAELSVLMGHEYARDQYGVQPYLYPDYRGGYRRFGDVPRTTRAASRGEALGGAMRAAALIGADTDAFVTALLEGARHLLEQQFVTANSFYVPDGFDVQGAIRMGLVDGHCRIDNNQHAVVGLLRALEAWDIRHGK